MKLLVSKKNIRYLISELVSDLSIDTSNQSHDIRIYEGIDEDMIDEMTDSAWDDLITEKVV